MVESKLQKLGREILKRYLDHSSECEINVSYALKDELFHKLAENGNIFTRDIFDDCVKDVVQLIRQNVWNGFKASIMKMALDEDINFQPKMINLSTTKILDVPSYSDYPSYSPTSPSSQ